MVTFAFLWSSRFCIIGFRFDGSIKGLLDSPYAIIPSFDENVSAYDVLYLVSDSGKNDSIQCDVISMVE